MIGWDNMNANAINKSRRLAELPEEWPGDLLPEIQQQVTASGRKIVVLDDDPTGTQTVHGIPVLTTWSTADLKSELATDANGFYVLTNSRSLTPPAAADLGRQIGANLKQAAAQVDVPIAVISRSDSTLRGHFPQEVIPLSEALGFHGAPFLIVPFFLEGGRFTIDDIHYVAEGDYLVPAAETPYAQDAAFGFSNSNLRQWVAEKTAGAIPASRTTSISISDIREGGPQRVADILTALPSHSACVVNSASYRDQEVLVAGLLNAERQGKRFIYRTAASFVRVRAGIAPRDLIARTDLTVDNTHGGLFVVGSYVPKTTAQVEGLLESAQVAGIEVQVDQLLDESRQGAEIKRVANEINRHLPAGRDVAVFTSRRLVKSSDAKGSLAIGQRISDSLISIVGSIQYQPRFLVAKGGITSSDMATQGLNVRRALIMGQVLPGIPVWKLGPETRWPGMAYIVFPGNVGGDDALAVIQQRLAPNAKS